ncbi:hypothetical protein [Leeuwenhoekiella marinoflava]|uniref:Uncharacterized protein n=2 Tax=Leeuwenhoekiella marinoflava TaxID=988 RepID=A0A4V1KSH9_9FLAO|nr:hypothetical protein [Leeuwenhoekiella marinoflava]RXG31798.1 hypothetical protein DSL99_1622 [Leeuwenhoekiella marinoflava]SHF04784.1 hypothetical protein SAMN02745246_01560 [Leeuwenhoekiella marinoflava DSM 3653]
MEAKKLIHQDNKGVENIHKDLKKIKPLLVNMLTGYKSLEMGDFSDKVFQEIKKGGLRNMEQKYLRNIESQIKKVGITSSLIKANLIKGSNDIFQKFKDDVQNVISFRDYHRGFNDNTPFLKLEMIDYVGGSFMITEETEAKFIEEHCKVYLETEQQHKIYEAANKFLDGFKELISELEAVGYRGAMNVNSIAEYFFHAKDGQYNLKPHSIKSAIEQDVIYKQRLKEFGTREQKRAQAAKERQERLK